MGDRLRSMPLARLPERLDVVRLAAQRIADETAHAEGRPVRPLPDLPVSSLGDLVAVVAGDARACPHEALHDRCAAILAELRGSL